MTSSGSDAESECYQTDDSDWNYIPGPYTIRGEATEVEASVGEATAMSTDNAFETDVGPYADEPVADEEWFAEYRERRQTYDARMEELQRRLDGLEEVCKWCSCGNCDVQLLQNAKECQCCKEIEECHASLTSEIVLQEVESPPSCVTEHPGFNTVCLDKWSLRLAASKLRDRQKREYRQTGTEDRFLRSTAYRSFVWLIYGRLGNKRYPLPACAYTKIRQRFKPDSQEDFVGFTEED